MWNLDPEFVFLLMIDCKRLFFFFWQNLLLEHTSAMPFQKVPGQIDFSAADRTRTEFEKYTGWWQRNDLTVSWRGRRVNSCSTVPNTKITFSTGINHWSGDQFQFRQSFYLHDMVSAFTSYTRQHSRCGRQIPSSSTSPSLLVDPPCSIVF